jgi:GNAT superfamily N-acetyltransferase
VVTSAALLGAHIPFCVEYIGSVTTVRLATLDDVPQMAHVQMRAFQDDPLITWMLPPEDFDRRATLLFDSLIRASMLHESIYTTDDVVGAAMWAPPEAWVFSDEQTAMMAEPFAEAAGERIDHALGVLIELSEVHPSEPHWYLEVLGTHPDWQRRGIASAVLAPVLSICDADGLPAYLETQRESNVPFYRRHGFDVIGTKQLSNGGPKMWLMWREVRSATSRVHAR